MSLIKPPRLRVGDTVAIVNPSLALDPARLAPATARLTALGLHVRLMPHVGGRWTPPPAADQREALVLAGADAQRADDLNRAFADPTVRLVLAAHGGGGAARLLQPGLIDWPALAADPKLLCGFSDFGHLLVAAHHQLDLVTIDGPSALQWAGAADEPMLRQAWRVLTGAQPVGPLPAADQWYASQLPPSGLGSLPPRPRAGQRRWLRSGRTSGRLLSLMPAMLLTLHEHGLAPSLAGRIWCLDSYRSGADQLATWLADLDRRGLLTGLAGLVAARAWPSAQSDPAALDAALLQATAHLQPPPPVLADADTGHTWPKWSLPNGLLARLDSAADHFSIDEVAVQP